MDTQRMRRLAESDNDPQAVAARLQEFMADLQKDSVITRALVEKNVAEATVLRGKVSALTTKLVQANQLIDYLVARLSEDS